MSDTVFTPPQVAQRWRCKPEIVRKMIERGILPAFNVADPDATRPRWRISLDAVLEYESGERSSAPEPQRPQRTRRIQVPEGPF